MFRLETVGSSQQYSLKRLEWSEEQSADSENPHINRTNYSKSVEINNRLYIFSNISPSNQTPLKIVDFDQRRLFSIKFEKFGPSVCRINYSISNFKHKAYLYGGIDENNKIVESMDEFDGTTYKFTQVKYRLEVKPAGRQGHCSVVIDQYNMFIIGGSYQTNLIDPVQIPADEMIINFDMDASTF